MLEVRTIIFDEIVGRDCQIVINAHDITDRIMAHLKASGFIITRIVEKDRKPFDYQGGETI